MLSNTPRRPGSVQSLDSLDTRIKHFSASLPLPSTRIHVLSWLSKIDISADESFDIQECVNEEILSSNDDLTSLSEFSTVEDDESISSSELVPPVDLTQCIPSIRLNGDSSALLPAGTSGLLRRLNPRRLTRGCLPIWERARIKGMYPRERLDDSFFSTETTGDIVDHINYIVRQSMHNTIDRVPESGWHPLIVTILEGIGLDEEIESRLEVHTAKERRFNTLPKNAPDVGVAIHIQGRSLRKDTGTQITPPRNHLHSDPKYVSLNPTRFQTCRYSPLFALAEVKSATGDLLEARRHGAIGAASTLLKARSLGAEECIVSCVPFFTVIGSIWCLNLLYETEDGSFCVEPTPLFEDTKTFLGALTVVCVVEELRSYGCNEWWQNFVEGPCADVLDEVAVEQRRSRILSTW
ncbi:hypothetical protein TWF730_001444 [Orbilia blumenaviensis]|uniref:PD-(D/E)XK nuclease-like domain-containing protein n=1 Tax=Orbilia blumenaviensis TaxID=1796055 RepID=A0AAV9UHP8_9PEZI